MTFTASLDEIISENANGLLGVRPGWGRTPLKEVASILNGFPFKSDRFTKGNGTPLLRIRDILRGSTETFYDGEFDPAFLVQAGDLVVGMDGDFNCGLWAGPPALLNQRVCKITVDGSRYSRRFLSYVLPGYLTAINAATPSLTVRHLSSRTVAAIPLPAPPLAEQLELADELDKQLTRLDAGVGALKRVQANLKRYRAAVLKAACEGRLVPTEAELACSAGRSYESGGEHLRRILESRRSEAKGKARYREPAALDLARAPVLPEGWTWAALDHLATKITDGAHHTPDYVSRGVPFISVKDIREGVIHFDHTRFISPQTHGALTKRCHPEPGDVLITKSGTIGRTAVVTSDRPFSLFVSVALIKPVRPLVNPQFVRLSLDAYVQSIDVAQDVKGGLLKNLHVEDLRLVPVPIPPSAEQSRIVSEVERRLSLADQQGRIVTANLDRAIRVRQSLLAAAFSGHLGSPVADRGFGELPVNADAALPYWDRHTKEV